ISFFFSLSRRPLRSSLFPYTTLFRSVVGLTEVAIDARSGCREDDPTIPLLAHVRPGGAGHLVGAFDVHPVDQVPIGILHLVEARSEEHTSELQSRENLVCRLLLEKKK